MEAFSVFGYYNSAWLHVRTALRGKWGKWSDLCPLIQLRAELGAEALELDISGQKPAQSLSSMLTGWHKVGWWILSSWTLTRRHTAVWPSLPSHSFSSHLSSSWKASFPAPNYQPPASTVILESPFTWSSLGPSPIHWFKCLCSCDLSGPLVWVSFPSLGRRPRAHRKCPILSICCIVFACLLLSFFHWTESSSRSELSCPS